MSLPYVLKRIKKEIEYGARELGIELEKARIFESEPGVNSVRVITKNRGELKVINVRDKTDLFLCVQKGEDTFELAERMGKKLGERDRFNIYYNFKIDHNQPNPYTLLYKIKDF